VDYFAWTICVCIARRGESLVVEWKMVARPWLEHGTYRFGYSIVFTMGWTISSPSL